MPKFAHLPLLLKPDGNGKLSKRDGDRLGFPVFPLQWTDPVTQETSSGYRESGYLPEAFVNMLSFLGWNPGTDQEIYSMDELVSAFSLERVGKHGSKFDPEKAKWFNHQYLQKKTDEELSVLLIPMLKDKGISPAKDYVLKVIGLIRERANLIPDLWNQSSFFFVAPSVYDPLVIQKVWNSSVSKVISAFAQHVAQVTSWTDVSLNSAIQEFIISQNIKMGQLMNPLRLIIVGGNIGPGMMDIAVVLGKEEFTRRIETGLGSLPK